MVQPTLPNYRQMDEQPAMKRQRILSVPEGPMSKALASLAGDLKALYHRVDSIQCKIGLPLSLSDIQSLQAHLTKFGERLDKNDKPVPRHKCPQCQRRYERQDRLFAHCEVSHPEKKYLNLLCPCPRSFRYLGKRNEHLRSCHPEEYEMERLLIEGSGLCSNVILMLQLNSKIRSPCPEF